MKNGAKLISLMPQFSDNLLVLVVFHDDCFKSLSEFFDHFGKMLYFFFSFRIGRVKIVCAFSEFISFCNKLRNRVVELLFLHFLLFWYLLWVEVLEVAWWAFELAADFEFGFRNEFHVFLYFWRDVCMAICAFSDKVTSGNDLIVLLHDFLWL